MRRISEKRTGEFHDLLPELQQYAGGPARVYFFDEYGTGISFAQGGTLDIAHGDFIIRREDTREDSVVVSPQGREITYSSDNVDGPYVSFPAGLGKAKITIDFL